MAFRSTTTLVGVQSVLHPKLISLTSRSSAFVSKNVLHKNVDPSNAPCATPL